LISRLSLPLISTTFALAIIIFMPGVIATQSMQAQTFTV
jgi:hypothetical protein